MSRDQKRLLLLIARKALEAKLAGEPLQLPESDVAPPLERRGAFVTLHKYGQLRGCIGCFTANQPLYEVVAEMAVSAGLRDPRFPPLSPEELPEIDIEISALTPLKPISQIEDIEVGKHGIYIMRGPYHGVLLPQVATQYGWDRETFLDQTCYKAGMEPGCWRDSRTQIFTFSAEIFSEHSEGLRP